VSRVAVAVLLDLDGDNIGTCRVTDAEVGALLLGETALWLGLYAKRREQGAQQVQQIVSTEVLRGRVVSIPEVAPAVAIAVMNAASWMRCLSISP